MDIRGTNFNNNHLIKLIKNNLSNNMDGKNKTVTKTAITIDDGKKAINATTTVTATTNIVEAKMEE